MRRASSLEQSMFQYFSVPFVKGTLASRVASRMDKIAQRLNDGEDEDDEDDEDLDLMEDGHLELLCKQPDQRGEAECEKLADILSRFAPKFTQQLQLAHLMALSKTCLYHFFDPDTVVCESNESCNFYFLILRGSVHVEERIVHHQEGLQSFIRRAEKEGSS